MVGLSSLGGFDLELEGLTLGRSEWACLLVLLNWRKKRIFPVERYFFLSLFREKQIIRLSASN